MKKRLFNRKLMLVSVLMMLLVMVTAVVYAANVVIDDFATTPQSSADTWFLADPLPKAQVCTHTNPGVPDALGGYRDVCVQITDASIDDENARLRTVVGHLIFILDPSVKAQGIVQWDGNDSSGTLDPVGLSPKEDLTGGGTNDGIVVRVVNSDGVSVDITLRIYTDALNWGEQTINFATPVVLGSEVVDIFFPFADFVDQPGGAMDETDVGAVEAELVSINAGADMNITLVEATSIWDFGDLPAPYNTTTAANGARHRPTTGLRLGNNVDAEIDGVPSGTAVGDDNAAVVGSINDEDGVVRQPSAVGSGSNGGWTNGAVSTFNGGALNITITGGTGVPQVFVDFGGGLNEVTLLNFSGNPLPMPMGPGTHLVRFSIPPTFFDGTNNSTIPVRVRLSNLGGLTADGPAGDGEVEDYIYGFGPTAVSLQNVSANSTDTLPTVGIIAIALLAIVGTGAVITRRQRA